MKHEHTLWLYEYCGYVLSRDITTPQPHGGVFTFGIKHRRAFQMEFLQWIHFNYEKSILLIWTWAVGFMLHIHQGHHSWYDMYLSNMLKKCVFGLYYPDLVSHQTRKMGCKTLIFQFNSRNVCLYSPGLYEFELRDKYSRIETTQVCYFDTKASALFWLISTCTKWV